MKYGTYIPTDILKPYIRHFTVQETDAESSYKVLPATGMVMGFQYSGKMSYVEGGKEVALSGTGITGLRNKYRVFKSSDNIGSVLVYFKEAGAASFFKQPLHEIFNDSVSLDNFMLRSTLAVLEEQLCEAATSVAKIAVVEQFLINRLSPTPTDKLVLGALSLIHKNIGNIKITELCTQLHTSQSPLEKKFRAAVGCTPKKYASIVRFTNVLQQKNNTISLTGLGYEAGFYDQAHFIKEFKSFTGETPEAFFQPKN